MKDWKQEDKTQQLWERDSRLWTNSDESKWLGWLEIVQNQQRRAADFLEIQKDFKNFTHVAVLGMGGSSLCAEVLAKIFWLHPGFPKLHVLDSTDPQQILNFEKDLAISKTCFIISSKSGSTLEPNLLFEYFYAR